MPSSLPACSKAFLTAQNASKSFQSILPLMYGAKSRASPVICLLLLGSFKNEVPLAIFWALCATVRIPCTIVKS